MFDLKPLLAQLKAQTLVKKYSEDGGPGSGNFGHSGRPGKVGGSGKGGGKQYRGGRADIGYFNSRNDWLNGLNGEEQHRASQLLKEAKTKIYEGSNSTPESFIMSKWDSPNKRELVELAGKARSWDELAMRLQRQNLTNEEQKYLAMISMDYHLDHNGKEDDITDEEYRNYNLDRVLDKLTDEQRHFYLDMKAKACGLPTKPTPIDDYSDEFQIQVGAKEKPQETPAEKNKNWLYADNVRSWDKSDIDTALMAIGVSALPDHETGKIDMNDVEHRIESQIVKQLAEGNKQVVDYAREYTRRKQLITGVKAEEILARGDSEAITEEQRKLAKDMLEAFAGPLPYGQPLEGVADIAEQKMFENKDLPDMYKAYYLGLKLRVLGLTDKKPEEDLLERVWGDFARENIPEHIKFEKKHNGLGRQERNQQYFQNKSNNKVVIKDDAMSEGVDRLRKADGHYTNDEFKKIGEVVAPEFERACNEYKKKHEELVQKYEKAWNEYKNAEKKDDESYDEYTLRRVRLSEESMKLGSEVSAHREEARNVISDLISRVRKTGFADKKVMKDHLEGRSPAKALVEEAYQGYPTDWIEASIQYGKVWPKKNANRGYYGSGDVVIDGEGKRAREVATHELAHRFEETVPGIKEAEKEFYDKRTEGEEPIPLRKLTGNRRYRSDEVAKKDQFVHPYIGKDYDGSWYEVVSMGFQYAFHEPEMLLKDKEYANLILGLLAVG